MAGLAEATEDILDAASEFLWSDEMEQSLEAFYTNHASLFDCTVRGPTLSAMPGCMTGLSPEGAGPPLGPSQHQA